MKKLLASHFWSLLKSDKHVHNWSLINNLEESMDIALKKLIDK